MVIALFCTLIGVVRAKITMSRDAIDISAPGRTKRRGGDNPELIPIGSTLSDDQWRSNLELLESVWGLPPRPGAAALFPAKC